MSDFKFSLKGNLYTAGQLIDKTIFINRPLNFYRVTDIINIGDKAKPIANTLKTGYNFVLDSVLMPTQAFTKYSFTTAARDVAYWTFYGNDKKYYAVKYADDNRFDFKKIIQQGAQNTAQQQAATEQILAPVENPINNLLIGLSKTAKTVLYIGVGVFAVGYLLPKILKK